MEGQPADLLRDPADLSPAERTHDLVAAVARDDLLAVVLVLHSADPEDVLAVGQFQTVVRPPPRNRRTLFAG